MFKFARRDTASPAREDESVTLQSLEAQTALLPQALAMFGVSLPIFVWAASFADNSKWMAASFAVFAVNWGVFYAIVNWLKGPAAANVGRRLRVQMLGGALWAGSVAQIAAFADNAGPVREPLLLMAAAGAIICMFFAAPSLPSLLIVGPAAMAGPLVALYSRPQSWNTGVLAWGAFALAFLLCLILNRNLRRQFELAAERERLIADRATHLAAAERLARSKSDLVATLSHEIRNGLTGVAHVLEAAAGSGARSAPSREQLNAALAAANDLIAVLNATLDTETAEAGRLSIDAAPFDAVRLIRDLAVLTRPQAAAKGLEFGVYIENELDMRTTGAAIADAARVRQVLANLLSNAVKYSIRGRIEARVERSGADRIKISIADTGPGLSAEELERAFEPFQRVERTGAGVPGAGLGLSLSRQLVRLMGAELQVQSAVGVGSVFWMELPYDPALPHLDAESHDSGPAITAAGLKVLMAEDDGLNAAMLRAILEQLGHLVVHAQNGRRAVELIEICDFDIILLDGRMPQMDGPQTARAIRALESSARATPIVAVIGGEAEEARECLAAGADVVIRKPVNVAAVARAIAQALATVRTDVKTQAAG